MLDVTLDFFNGFESFVGVNFWTMIFAWLNLLILYLLMKKFLFGPIKNMIDSRQKEVDDMYTEAEEAKASAETMRLEYEERLEEAKSEGEEIIRNAERRAEARGEGIIKDAETEAERIIERAEREIEQERKRTIEEVKGEVSDMAISIATAVIERDVSAEEHRGLIDSFIDKMGEDK